MTCAVTRSECCTTRHPSRHPCCGLPTAGISHRMMSYPEIQTLSGRGARKRRFPEEFLEHANAVLDESSAVFRKAGTIIITFGTAWVFRHIGKDIIVSNCHKHPAWEFRRERLSVQDTVALWDDILERFSEKTFIFTVSPIRHLKDGLHGNQLSKATLLLAEDVLVGNHPNARYFPAYEIVLDELRDYSWYDEDKVHPNASAVKIVWERFSEKIARGL